jgi:signal transduction histidine kinase
MEETSVNATIETARPRGYGVRAVLADPATWRSTTFFILHFPLAIAWFVITVVTLSISAGTLVIWVGVPLLSGGILVWRGAAMLERRLAGIAFRVPIADPYRKLPNGSLWAKWKALFADWATWKDFAFLQLSFPIAIAEFVVTVTLWVTSLSLMFAPVVRLIPGNDADFYVSGSFGRYDMDSPVTSIPMVPVGVLLAIVTLYVVRGMGLAHGAFAKLLLSPSETQALRARAAQLQSSRARGVDAAESERRRIERDLHDGAQQQLLAVAMDLGRARAKLEDDPQGAEALIQQAHAGAKEAIAELRNLARGIYPAILTDRGLDAAISAVAARADVPVEVEFELTERPPAAVESIAYFIVSEALTNVTKYARATRAAVRVCREDNWVVVEISDNGVGGATATQGGGLSGLADRAATIDGILTVNSPLGGPTVVRADLPCVW